MSDLITRLRALADLLPPPDDIPLRDAADVVEKIVAEGEAMRERLAAIDLTTEGIPS